MAAFTRLGAMKAREIVMLKTSLGDAQGARTVLVAAPHRKRAAGLDLLDETFGHELGDDLAGRAARQFGRPFKATVVALRGC